MGVSEFGLNQRRPHLLRRPLLAKHSAANDTYTVHNAQLLLRLLLAYL